MENTRKIEGLLEKSGLSEQNLADYLGVKGWGCEHPSTWRIDYDESFREIWEQVSPYTMISMERGYAVYQAVRHVLSRDLPGDFVECGVWRGGSCMLMALTLLQEGVKDRAIWLFDTFSGMTEPGPEDRISSSGQAVSERWHQGWWEVSPEQVRSNLEKTSYPSGLFRLVQGDVCETLVQEKPSKLALLRLDTDWYESTLVELNILYPLLVSQGVLVIDDYGHFSGSRKAVDEYFCENPPTPLLQRSDYTGRLAVKLD